MTAAIPPSADEPPSSPPTRGWWQRLRGLASGNGETARSSLDHFIDPNGDEAATNGIGDHERLLIDNILKLRDMTAADVMVPRADISAVDESATSADLVALVAKSGHSRLPVYRNTLDRVVGFVHLKALVGRLPMDETVPVRDLVSDKLLFVSPFMRVLDLLLEMRLKRIHLVLVVDEFGGIDGLITIEDLVEQIVGEIEDEFEQTEEPRLTIRPDGTLEADARVTLEDLEAQVGEVLTEGEREDIDTVGGLVFQLAGHVPARGELVTHASGMRLRVVEADPRRIKRVIVSRLPTREEANAEATAKGQGKDP